MDVTEIYYIKSNSIYFRPEHLIVVLSLFLSYWLSGRAQKRMRGR